jgi:hypothetical protein
MALLNTLRLATFARLIALGHPPPQAAENAGFWNLRASRAAMRLAPRPDAATPKAPRAAAAAKETKAADKAKAQAAPPERPPLPPMLTEEEWLRKYHPDYRDQAAAPA